MENKISACLVVYNEEKIIERCLKSLKNVVDEIIIVHDGECSDKTLEIAKKYGAKTFIRPHNGEAEKHRPFTYREAKYEWILQLDADEYLSEKLNNSIRDLVKDPSVDAYIFSWPLFDGQKYIKGFEDEGRITLLRKSKLYYVGISHEAPQTYGNIKERLDLVLEHRPTYNNYTIKKVLTKWLKWNDIQAKEIVNYKDADSFNIDDKDTNKLYVYYRKQINHPFIFLFRYITIDFIKKIISGKLFKYPYNTIKLSIFLYISFTYLTFKIIYYKNHNE